MSAPGAGWPFPDRPGVPLNPERDGWHWWLGKRDGAPTPVFWNAAGRWWAGREDRDLAAIGSRINYLGPVPTAADQAAREAAVEDAKHEAKLDGMDAGATIALRALAGCLDVKEWEGGDGSETFEGDVAAEVQNIFKAAGFEDGDPRPYLLGLFVDRALSALPPVPEPPAQREGENAAYTAGYSDGHADGLRAGTLRPFSTPPAHGDAAEVERLRAALTDMLGGWRYIRANHGDLYGAGWDRAQDAAEAALRPAAPEADHG